MLSSKLCVFGLPASTKARRTFWIPHGFIEVQGLVGLLHCLERLSALCVKWMRRVTSMCIAPPLLVRYTDQRSTRARGASCYRDFSRVT